jgi:hypothetical protein
MMACKDDNGKVVNKEIHQEGGVSLHLMGQGNIILFRLVLLDHALMPLQPHV